MKRTLVILTFAYVFPDVTAQSGQAGLYATLREFQEEKLSFAFPCDSSKNKIKIHDFLSHTITVRSGGQAHHFKTADIFGYLDCKGDKYRFFKSTAFHVFNIATLCIYMEERIRDKSILYEKIHHYTFK